MTAGSRLIRLVTVIAALFVFSAQVQAQTLTPAQQTAYNNLITALQGNTDADETGDEALVTVARNAGLPDTAIAGALSSEGRSSDAVTRAMLPANPTQAQVNNVAAALVNATDGQGNTVNTGVNNANVGTVLNNANVPINLVANVIVAPPLGGAPGVPGTGAAGGLGAALGVTGITGIAGISAGAPAPLANAAFITQTPLIPVTTTTSITTPTIVVPDPIHPTL